MSNMQTGPKYTETVNESRQVVGLATGGLLGRAEEMAGSTADLFPKVAGMQRLCFAEGFALLAAQEQTQQAPGSLDVVMNSPGSEDPAEALIKQQSGFLLAHLKSSPRPVIFAKSMDHVAHLSSAIIANPVSDDRNDLAFPVNLGVMGNGYVCFFGIRETIDNVILMDLHRKALMIMREKLRLTFGATPAVDKLNEREIECLQLVGNGMKSEAIGDRLNLSVHTVNAYLGSATTKLDAVSRIQAIAKAIRLGIIA